MNGTGYNPWSTDRCSANLRSAILLAQRTGHFVKKVGEGDAQVLADMPSVKQIRLQREIALKKKELNKVNFEIQQKMQHHEVKDIIQVNILEKRTEELKKLSDHIGAINCNKDSLIMRLQQPFTGDYLRLEAGYHKEACDLLRRMAPILSGLSSYLQDLSWLNRQDLFSGEVDELLSDISSALAGVQTTFQIIVSTSEHIAALQKSRDTASSTSTTPRSLARDLIMESLAYKDGHTGS